MINSKLAERIGWGGASLIIIAYLLVTIKSIESSSLSYHLLNLAGAIGIIVISFDKKVYQTAVLNIFWAVIALIAIANIFL